MPGNGKSRSTSVKEQAAAGVQCPKMRGRGRQGVPLPKVCCGGDVALWGRVADGVTGRWGARRGEVPGHPPPGHPRRAGPCPSHRGGTQHYFGQPAMAQSHLYYLTRRDRERSPGEIICHDTG